ncbi:hypothetical protein EMCRGX_G026085 [Ephydatia muelleri]
MCWSLEPVAGDSWIPNTSNVGALSTVASGMVASAGVLATLPFKRGARAYLTFVKWRCKHRTIASGFYWCKLVYASVL